MSDNHSSIDLLFAGFLVDDATFEAAMIDEPFPQHAAQRYQKTIISMLSHLNWRSFNIIGSIPTSAYPSNPNWVFKKKTWSYKGLSGYSPFLLNLPLIRKFCRLFGFFYYLIKWAGKSENKNKLILLYALHTPHLLAVYLTRLVFGVKVIVYVPDLPIYMNTANRLPFYKRCLKGLDSYLLLKMANRLDGRIVITENMFHFIKSENSLVIDSIVLDEEDITETKIELPEGNNIIYSGGLNEDYGIKEMVGSFLSPKVKSARLNLVICGGGPLSDWCSNVASKNSNIFYLGIINNNEVVSIQRKSYALINLRNTTEEYTKYSFPSKVAEYMQAGVPVITTRLEGIPEDLIEYLNIVDQDSIKVILDVKNNYPDILLKAKLGTKYFKSSRSSEEQTKKILSLI